MDKPLEIAFKDLESSEFLERLIRERAGRLERMHPHIIACRVVVETPHGGAQSGKLPLGIAVEVEVPGKQTLVAKKVGEPHEAKGDRTAPVNDAFEAVERQLASVADTKRRAVKQHEAAPDTGVVVRLFPEQDYGFGELRGSPDLFFARAVVDGDFDALEVGDHVHVTPSREDGPMGPQAASLRLFTGKRP